MNEANDRRREDRLAYHWPIWFSEDFAQHMSPGLMLDISRGGIAFTYSLSEGHLCEGQSLSVALDIPRADDEDPGSTVNVRQAGKVARVEKLSDGRARVALHFDRPLELGVAEQMALEIMGADTGSVSSVS